jgi:hypothetical protein
MSVMYTSVTVKVLEEKSQICSDKTINVEKNIKINGNLIIL